MVAFAGDFDDLPEERDPGPPLPPEDRLWRHPSELGNANPRFPLDPVAVRRRWLQTEPSRASAWTAGLVGALLATGLVVLGTHLATALTGRSPAPDPDAVPVHTVVPVAPAAGLPTGSVGPLMAAKLTRIGRSVVLVDAMLPSGETKCLGVVIRSDGMLVVPSRAVAKASSVLVTLSGDGGVYVAKVVASDAGSGLAVVHINGVKNLPVAHLTTVRVEKGDTAIAIGSPGGTTYRWGTVTAPDMAPNVGTSELEDAFSTDLANGSVPPGSAVLNASGAVVGLVSDGSARYESVVPSWLAGPVTRELLASRAVRHGWLDIEGETVAGAPGRPRGIDVHSVLRAGSAARGGLVAGDIIVSLNGFRITSLAALRGRLYVLDPGTVVRLGVERAGHTTTRLVALGASGTN